jgi:putative phosphoribosyl transferase
MRSRASIVFRDREDAGRQLATKLAGLAGSHPVVLGLPRGGVPVAAQVALALRAPLDVILVRKLGVPYQPELAAGAIGGGGVRVVNEEVRRAAQVGEHELAVVEARERDTLVHMAQVLRKGRPAIPLQGRTVVVVDDGVATGSTARAACQVARVHGASRVVLAAPVIPSPTHASLGDVVDEIVCVESPEPFFAIGQWYDDFTQTTDDEVVRLLDAAAARFGVPTAPAAPTASADSAFAVDLATGETLQGTYSVPDGATGIVVFAHGSGSSSSSPRNRAVARKLQAAGLGTVLFDLLTPRESEDQSRIFDVELLAARLARATRRVEELAPDLPLGYFGASTGAAAALLSAAGPGSSVAAVVSRGGRPDLAGDRLGEVRAPTLLIVGGNDPDVLDLNRRALDVMRCERQLAIVKGATHLFEETGALDRVAELAADWFSAHLPGRPHKS